MTGANRAAIRAESALVGVAWLLLALGLAVQVLTAPPATRAVARLAGSAKLTGLSEQRTLQLAEAVRAFVSDRGAAPLPATVDGRTGFVPTEVSHLDDVRDVIGKGRIVTALLALGLAMWLVWGLARGRITAVARALRSGGALTLTFIVVAAAASVFSFEQAFTAFHDLFFKPGTWMFPPDSLLIEVFPEPFWQMMGVLLALLVAMGGGVMLLAASRLGRAAPVRPTDPSAQAPHV
jgi:integral membrane protein (TIGR01906 family)